MIDRLPYLFSHGSSFQMKQHTIYNRLEAHLYHWMSIEPELGRRYALSRLGSSCTLDHLYVPALLHPFDLASLPISDLCQSQYDFLGSELFLTALLKFWVF